MNLGLGDVIRSQITTMLANLYTAMPAKVLTVSTVGTQVVIDAKPLINRVDPDGAAFELPTLPEVPVMFPSGGGAIVSFPVEVGDIVLLVFSMRSIDELLASDGQLPQTPFSKRKHSLSDAIAIPGLLTSITSPEIDLEVLSLRNGIGETESEIKIQKDGKIVINAATAVEIGEGATEHLILGDAFKTYFDTHTHPTGVGPSGPPIAVMPPATLSTYSTTN